MGEEEAIPYRVRYSIEHASERKLEQLSQPYKYNEGKYGIDSVGKAISQGFSTRVMKLMSFNKFDLLLRENLHRGLSQLRERNFKLMQTPRGMAREMARSFIREMNKLTEQGLSEDDFIFEQKMTEVFLEFRGTMELGTLYDRVDEIVNDRMTELLSKGEKASPKGLIGLRTQILVIVLFDAVMIVTEKRLSLAELGHLARIMVEKKGKYGDHSSSDWSKISLEELSGLQSSKGEGQVFSQEGSEGVVLQQIHVTHRGEMIMDRQVFDGFGEASQKFVALRKKLMGVDGTEDLVIDFSSRGYIDPERFEELLYQMLRSDQWIDEGGILNISFKDSEILPGDKDFDVEVSCIVTPDQKKINAVLTSSPNHFWENYDRQNINRVLDQKDGPKVTVLPPSLLGIQVRNKTVEVNSKASLSNKFLEVLKTAHGVIPILLEEGMTWNEKIKREWLTALHLNGHENILVFPIRPELMRLGSNGVTEALFQKIGSRFYEGQPTDEFKENVNFILTEETSKWFDLSLIAKDRQWLIRRVAQEKMSYEQLVIIVGIITRRG